DVMGAATPATLVRTSLTLCAKDLRIELRTREIVTTAGFFAALVAIMASVSFYSDQDPARVAPGAIWISVAFASVLALSRAWQRERDEAALTGLLIAPIPRAAIFLGKGLSVFAFVTTTELVVVPIVGLLFHLDLLPLLGPLVLLLVLGTVGVAATGTLFGV